MDTSSAASRDTLKSSHLLVCARCHRLGGTPARLHQFLLSHRPTCFHFVGHADAAFGGHPTLGFCGGDGTLQLIAPVELVKLFKPFAGSGSDQMQLIVINGCESEKLAIMLHEDAGIANVVCWRTRVRDEACSVFAKHFWSALLQRDFSVRGAFEHAATELEHVTRSGSTMLGSQWKPANVRKWELRDPSQPHGPVPFTPPPEAAGIPVLVCAHDGKTASFLPQPLALH